MRTRTPRFILLALALAVAACDFDDMGRGLPDEPGPDQLTAEAVTAGWEHTCALREGGTIVCWGDNKWGQIGDGSTTERHTPVAVDGITDAVSVSAGRGHTCALGEGGTVACWGHNNDGQVGDGTTTDRHTPVAVDGISDAIAVTAGFGHTCALREGGTVACWGSNERGQLGDGTTAQPVTPFTLEEVTDVVAVTAGPDHTCALRDNGTVACWGDGSGGKVVHVPALTDAMAVSAGYPHTCALREGGAVACWSTFFDLNGMSPRAVSGIGWRPGRPLAGVVAVSAGVHHTCALRDDGTVACWGENRSGELGDGITTQLPLGPTTVDRLADAVAVSAGGDHTCALRDDGTVVCWGLNEAGQLGDGTTTSRSRPTPVVTG